MTTQEKPKKAFVSVVEMSEMLDLSKSRFHFLIQAGVFPKAIRHESCRRPVYDAKLQQECLEIRQTGVGHNGSPVLFNQKRRSQTQQKPCQGRLPITEEQAELVEAMRSLGLTAKAEEVQLAMRELFPTGKDGIDQGEVVRRVFLHLRGKKK